MQRQDMSGIHVIAKASTARAATAVAVAPTVPLMILLLLSRSGHSILDIAYLLQSGQLSWTRQILMVVAFAVFVIFYVPPAIFALRNPLYIFTNGEMLIVPNGGWLKIGDIKSIRVRKGFWHKILEITTTLGTEKVVVTFAKGGVNNILNGLRADRRLREVLLES